MRRIETIAQRAQPVRRYARADLDAHGVADAAHIFDMRTVQIGGTQSDPGEMRGQVVMARLARHLPGLRLFVVEQQRLVRSVEIHPIEFVNLLSGQGFHEAQRTADGLHAFAIGLGQRRMRHPRQVPVFRVVQIGKAAVDQTAHEVDRHCRIGVTFDQSPRVGDACFRRELGRVDQITAIGRQGDAVAGFQIGRARLGVLAGESSESNHTRRQTMHQHQGHLQQDLEAVGDDVRRAVGEGLGAVAALQHEGAPGLGLGQLRTQGVDFPGCHQRRQPSELRQRHLQRRRIRIVRLLRGHARLPRIDLPIGNFLHIRGGGVHGGQRQKGAQV